MELKDLAPWIAIAFTLALSILVPLFTQIANNYHQRKVLQEKSNYEEKQKKVEAYKDFLSAVGGMVTSKGYENSQGLTKAGSAIQILFAYAPDEWFDDLDQLMEHISRFEWDAARNLLKKLNRLISNELNDESLNRGKRGKQ